MYNSGVYSITNTITGAQYIGSSKNIKRRWERHREDLKRGAHHSTYMQRSYVKYGATVFVFKVIVVCDKDTALVIEQHALDKWKPKYNTSTTATHPTLSMEARTRIGEKVRASVTEERRKTLADKLRANPIQFDRDIMRTPEYRAKIRDIHWARLRKHEYQGRLWAIKEAAEHFGIHYGMLKDRVHAGWDFARAVETPKRKGGL